MCGIAAIYRSDITSPPGEDRMAGSLRSIAHRGPDDAGTYRNGRAVLGHRRLSIIDTSSAGHQPFTDNGGRYTIVFNGEVFNHHALRADLEAQGHTFRSHTDTEVVLRLFSLKGPAFLHELNGFFALAIHDAQEDTLFVARDRFGVKPLWWCAQDGHLLLASELRALEALGAHGSLDRHSLLQYFTYHYVPAPYSVIQGVRKLLPGELLRADATGVHCERWYDLPEAARRTPLPPDPVERLQELLDDAVRIRLVADVPVGTFLSGGLDSSIVSALAARHHPDLHTFSIGYSDDPYFDESRYAEEVAAYIRSRHTTFRLSRAELAEAYPRFLAALDEPFADSSALPSYLLCERTRRHVTVALSGDGADEVFGGYRKHQAELRHRSPGIAERAVIALGPLWRRLPRSRNSRVTDLFRKLDRFALAGSGTAEQRWLSLASFDTDGDAFALVPHAAHPVELDDRETGLTQGLRRMPGLNGSLLADVLTVLPNDMLCKVDVTSMAHALEVRTPFLDRRLVELAFRLPAEARFGKGAGKQVLRTAFGHLLPPSVLGRRKQGFEVPLRQLFLGPLAPLVDELLRPDLVEAAGLDPRAVKAVRDRLRGNAPGQAQATVHALLVYLSWWRMHGPGRS